ncbi:MAG: MASE3 domain-containing protein [Patescibacteria group bacterium]|nr:MASE3 domain-containing protein [Patescibacteria group bacterium]
MENLTKKSLLKNFPLYQLIFTTLAAALLFAVVDIFRDQLYFVLGSSAYLLFHNISEFLSIIVSISIFSVGWFTYKQTKNSFTLFIGVMLLGIGILDFMHVMSFPGMPGIISPGSTNSGIQFWITARLFFATAFLVAAFVPANLSEKKIPRSLLLALSLFTSVFLSLAIIIYQEQLPALFVEGLGLTPLKIFLEYDIIVLLILALIAFYFRYVQTKSRALVFCMQAFILSIFGELAFTLYISAYDTFNMLGHVYKALAFYLIYKAIFISAINEPYSDVQHNENELKRLNRMLKVLSGCNQAMVYAVEESELLRKICDLVVKEGGYRSAWIGFAEHDKRKSIRPVAQAGFSREEQAALASLSWDVTEKGYGPEGMAIRTGELVAIQDAVADPTFAFWRKTAKKRGYASVIALPLSVDSSVAGAFCLYSSEPNAFNREEIDLLTELSYDISYGIKSLRVGQAKKFGDQKIRNSEEKFAKAFYSSPNLMAITTPAEGRIIEINDAYCRVIGYGHGECVGHTTAELKIWADPEQRKKVIKAIKEKGFVRDVEADLRRPNGEIVTVMLSMEPIMLGDEELLLSVATDITERKRMELELRNTHEYLRNLIASANVMIVGLDASGQVVLFNEAAEKVTGYTFEELKGTKWFERIVPKERYPSVWDIFHKYQQQKDTMPREFENPILTKAGEERLIAWQNSTLATPDKTLLTISFGIDITERKKLDEALRRSERHLREAQKIARIGNWDWDAVKDVIWWSDEYYEVFGFDPKKPTPNYQEHLKVYTPESAKRLDAAVKLAMQAGEPYELDLEIQKPTTATRWIIARGEAKVDDKGKIWGLRGTAQDVTRKKEVELHIAQLSELRGKFLGIISHQLRTPVATIVWNLEALLSGNLGKLTKAQEKFMRMTYEASGRVSSRLNDLLTAIDIEEGRVLLRAETVELEDLVRGVMEDSVEKAAAKRIKFDFAIPAKGLPKVKGDLEKLQFVVSKLTENAIIYTKKGGSIDIKLSQKGDAIRFEVRDSGIGIPAAEQKNIFERFFRASNASVMQPDSFGLDLYMSKNFITQHQGKMGFRSKEGEGSVFWFEVPIA